MPNQHAELAKMLGDIRHDLNNWNWATTDDKANYALQLAMQLAEIELAKQMEDKGGT